MFKLLIINNKNNLSNFISKIKENGAHKSNDKNKQTL